MKKKIKNIYILGPLLLKLYKLLKSQKPFTNSENYWEERYKNGGNSGAGSYQHLAVFKAEIINTFLKKQEIGSVIEFGCGDGNQLKLLEIKKYLGCDVSLTAIENCKKIFAHDKSKEFILMSHYQNEKATLSMSLDVIYHLVEDEVFENYMQVLFNAAEKYVIIYSSCKEDKIQNDPHVRNRKFTDWIAKNKTAFSLCEYIPNQYPFNGDGENSSIADFYIFEKR